MSQPGHTEAAPTRLRVLGGRSTSSPPTGGRCPARGARGHTGREVRRKRVVPRAVVRVLGSLVGGTRRMLYLAVPFGVAGGLGALTAYGWWWLRHSHSWATAGPASGSGCYRQLSTLPFAATFASQVSSGRHAVAYGVFAGLGLLTVSRRPAAFPAPEVVEGQRVSAPAAVAVAAADGIAWGGTAADRCGLGMDPSLLGARADPHPPPPPREARTHPGEGPRHRGRRRCRSAGSDRGSADVGDHRHRHRSLRFGTHAVQEELLALLPRCSASLSCSRALPPAHVGDEAAHRGSRRS